MSKRKITGREREQDAAEAWLAENDPEYSERKRGWQTPLTDALAQDRDDDPALGELHPIGTGDGNYRRAQAGVNARSRKLEHEMLRRSPGTKDDDYNDG